MLSLVWAMAVALPRLSIDPRGNRQHFALALGFAIGVIVVAAGLHSRPLYIFGHELTHWLVAKLFRRRTGRFRVGLTRGSVLVEKPNIWIVLAPYFVPTYALAWIATGLLVHLWWTPPWYSTAFYGGLGLIFAHHLVLTLTTIADGQHDLLFHGRLFSIILIITGNIAVVYLALAALSGAPVHALRQLAVGFQQQREFLLFLWQSVYP